MLLTIHLPVTVCTYRTFEQTFHVSDRFGFHSFVENRRRNAEEGSNKCARQTLATILSQPRSKIASAL